MLPGTSLGKRPDKDEHFSGDVLFFCLNMYNMQGGGGGGGGVEAPEIVNTLIFLTHTHKAAGHVC